VVQGAQLKPATAAAVGVGATIGAGSTTAVVSGNAAGTGDAVAVGGSIIAAVGSATASGRAQGDYASSIAIGTAHGQGEAFGVSPPTIGTVKGYILRRSPPRVRMLVSDNKRVRMLRYPVPRPQEMLHNGGPRRVRELERA
jgi:hypothetical protein